MSQKPDLHKLFMIDDNHVAIRNNLDRLGKFIQQRLEAGATAVNFQVEREAAAVLASILIIDDPTV